MRGTTCGELGRVGATFGVLARFGATFGVLARFGGIVGMGGTTDGTGDGVTGRAGIRPDGGCGIGGIGCVASRGNGPFIVSTGTAGRLEDAPGITGSGRATCDGACVRAGPGRCDPPACDGPDGSPPAGYPPDG